MTERLLQYIWQFQYYNKSELTTTAGEALQIVFAGTLNTNQGPDFLLAKVKTGNTTWAGNIELHINSSHWNLHKHSADSNYQNVVLHVVWLDDGEISDASGNKLPALELQSRVSKLLLAKYEELMNVSYFIPCERLIKQVSELTFNSWKQRLLVERLQKRYVIIFDHLKQNNFHWEEMFWWVIAKNFGTHVNGDAFVKIAQSIPLNIIAKHKNQIQQLEALLFGQAGLLDGKFVDDYPVLLQKEYAFFTKKYTLAQPKIKLFFLRMRPANFPTLRLAQLAVLIFNSHHLFSKVKEADKLNDIKELLNVTANDYWHYHYIFDQQASFKKKSIGEQMINNILINTIVPVLFAYGYHQNEQHYIDRALNWLEQIPAEKNSITKGFKALNVGNRSSFDSQALIELKNNYCDIKRCLQCAVGNTILKSPV